MSSCLTRVGSDHSSILVDNGKVSLLDLDIFFFDQQWLLVEEFKGLVEDVWKKLRQGALKLATL